MSDTGKSENNITNIIQENDSQSITISPVRSLEVSTLTQENIDNDLINLLKEWNLEYIYSTLSACGITYDRIQYVKQDDIKEMFPGPTNIGLCCEIREKLSVWKSKNTSGSVTVTTSVTENSRVVSWLEKQEPSTIESQRELIQNVLNSSTAGQRVLKFYENYGKLNEQCRDELVNCVVENFYNLEQNSYVMPGRKQLKNISDGISNIFETEDPAIYYIPQEDGNAASGKLLNRFKRSNITTDSFNSIEARTIPNLDNQEKMHIKMKGMLNTANGAIDLWNGTFELRQAYIKKKRHTLRDIMNHWNFYKQAGGEKFIEMDFEIKYPTKKYALFEKWEVFREKIIQAYITKIQDKKYRELLDRILVGNISTDSANCLLIIMMNCILPPEVQDQNKKSTMQDRVNSMIQRVCTIHDLYRIKEILVNSAAQKNCFRPYIFVLGREFTEIDEFYVNLDDTLLKCSSFLSCLDLYLKSILAFDLHYPKESTLVWECLQSYFYDIDSAKDENNSALAELLIIMK